MELHEKIRKIRETEDLGRTMFSKLIGIPMKTIEGLEQKKRDPSGKFLKAVCNQFPEYTLWLMTNNVEPENGHISPEIKLKTMELNKTQDAGH